MFANKIRHHSYERNKNTLVFETSRRNLNFARTSQKKIEFWWQRACIDSESLKIVTVIRPNMEYCRFVGFLFKQKNSIGSIDIVILIP